MPIGFVFLGILLIFVAFSCVNSINKILYSLFYIISMASYFVNPLYLGKISLNVVVIISITIGLVFFLKKLSKKQMLEVLCWSSLIGVTYIVLTNINSDYITSLNPYPIFLTLVVCSLINAKKLNMVICFNILSFIFINICNLSIESGLEYIHFANVEMFNLILICVAIVLCLKMLINLVLLVKRRILWKRPL